jgi:hypothetical protein
MMSHSIQPKPLPHGTPESVSTLLQELQRENIRLQLLVSELLLRNQQLRTQQSTH